MKGAKGNIAKYQEVQVQYSKTSQKNKKQAWYFKLWDKLVG